MAGGRKSLAWRDGSAEFGLFSGRKGMLVPFVLSAAQISMSIASPAGFGCHWSPGLGVNFSKLSAAKNPRERRFCSRAQRSGIGGTQRHREQPGPALSGFQAGAEPRGTSTLSLFFSSQHQPRPWFAPAPRSELRDNRARTSRICCGWPSSRALKSAWSPSARTPRIAAASGRTW